MATSPTFPASQRTHSTSVIALRRRIAAKTEPLHRVVTRTQIEAVEPVVRGRILKKFLSSTVILPHIPTLSDPAAAPLRIPPTTTRTRFARSNPRNHWKSLLLRPFETAPSRARINNPSGASSSALELVIPARSARYRLLATATALLQHCTDAHSTRFVLRIASQLSIASAGHLHIVH